MPLEKVKCTNCGAEILLLTAQRHGGLCVHCVRAQYGMPQNMEGSYGWFSREQATLFGTFIYLDKDGNEIEVSSVSFDERGRPESEDTKFVGCVMKFLRQGRKRPDEALPKVIITPPPKGKNA